jgi:phosphate transport system permease protein
MTKDLTKDLTRERTTQDSVKPGLRGRWSTEALMTGLIWGVACLVVGVLLWLLGDLVRHGMGQLSWEFLTSAPQKSGRAGGIAPILISTALIVAVCLATAVPLGVSTAIWLVEFSPQQSLFGRWVRLSLDTLAGVPSIVFGLFGNAFFCKTLGLGFSILAGGLTLACMVLPLVIRLTQEGLRAVPDDYRRSAAALGISRTATLWRLLLPAAMPGLAVGVLLGLGRAIAETAALIFTSGYVDRTPQSLLDSGRALSVHIFDLAINIAGGEANAYGSALLLVILLVLINAVISGLARWFQASRIQII